MASNSSSHDEIAPFVCPKPGSSVLKRLTSSKRYFNKVAVDTSYNAKEAPPTIELLQLDKKLNQVAELEERLFTLKYEFINDIGSWQSHLPDQDCRDIIERLKQSINCQLKASRIVNEKLLTIALSVEAIKQRENKQTRLGRKRYEIEQKKKSVDFMHGLNSTDSNTLDDELEENFYNFKVVQGQFARAIKTQLKELVDDYVLTANYAIKNLSTTLETVVKFINDEGNESDELSESIDHNSNYQENKLDENELHNYYKKKVQKPEYTKIHIDRPQLNDVPNLKSTYYGGLHVHDKDFDIINSAEAWGK